jgi:tripartite-type tricarboxylate transporter receptor subunit TctC
MSTERGDGMKRIVLIAALVFFSTAASAQQAPAKGPAQTYPNRPVRLVIPWPPGQATDLAGRVLAQKLTELFGQQVVADNRAGAGGMIGTDVAAKAPPDGYTILAASSGPVTVSPLLQKAPYDVNRELAPVANIGLSPYLLVTGVQFPATSAREFVALVKANPGKFSFASSGTGATAHLIAEWFNSMAGLQVTHVPYKGSAPALTEVIGGQIAYSIETAAGTMPHVKSGRLKAYGVSLARGSALAPGIEPLATAANLPGFDVGAWLGVMVPAGTPKAIVDRIANAVDTAMQSAEVRERILGIGVEVDYRRTEDFTVYLKAQQARFADIIKKGNIKLE